MTLILPNNPDENASADVRVWAARITECWRSSVEGIIRTGRLLLEAKASLNHGAFGAMCAEELPFTQRAAQMLMAIAADARLTNTKFISHLPASWGSLYELTKLSDAEFDSALQQKIIRPDMIRADVDQIRALSRPHSSDGGVEKHGDFSQTRSESPGALDRIAGVAPGPSDAIHVHSPILDADGEWFCQGCGEVVEMTQAQTAPMPSGGLAIAHNRIESADSLDFFPTPPWATRALFEHALRHLDHLKFCKFQRAWEPACGEGHMAEPMCEYFRDVMASDKGDYAYRHFGIDFLEQDAGGLDAYDWIITNPPFNRSIDFVELALERAGVGVAMFVRAAWLEGVERYERIFRDHPPTLISFFAERVPLHKGRWEPDGATFTAYIWLVWIKGAEPRAPFWIPPGCRESLSRPEDIKKFGKAIVEGEAA